MVIHWSSMAATSLTEADLRSNETKSKAVGPLDGISESELTQERQIA